MDATALLFSRLQFAFTISFHIIFPSFTIGLAAWLTILEALNLATGRPTFRVVFEFWLKIFGVAFGLGVVSGIVMAFQFGTNWDVLARMVGPIQGVLLSYETFTAFFLEASFFGILLFGRSRVPPWFYLFSTAMVALGTTLSAFWILANNSWMQVPLGYAIENSQFVPTDWSKIIFSPVLWVRFPHMLLASFITGAFCVAATGAWYLLRGKFHAEARIMLRMGLFLAAILVPIQIFFGHLNGDYVHDYQPAKFAAIEARWHDEQPASEVLIAIPDPKSETNLYAISIPVLGSIIGSMSFDSKEVGLTSFPPQDRPPVIIPFFAFRIMVGCGWDASFAGGSFVAAFIQGLMVGALVEGLPISNGQYVGGEFGWFSPFSLMCGAGLCLGYTLLGACWLVRKTEGEIRDAAYRLIPYLAIGLLVFLIVVFAYALAENLWVISRWLERPYLLVFPAIGVVAAIVLAASVRQRRDEPPFYMVALIFVAAFGTLAISFWPYMIPFTITVADAAAPHSSLAFMFWGEGLFVFPLMLVYTAISYSVFRGKVRSASANY